MIWGAAKENEKALDFETLTLSHCFGSNSGGTGNRMKLHRCHFSAHGLVRAYSHLKAGRRLCRATGLRFWPLIPESVNSMTAAYNVYRTLRDSGLPWPETIIDIGANESQMARLLLAMNPRARVISFEPNPTASPIGEVMRMALSDTDGEADLWVPAHDPGWGTIEPGKDRVSANAQSFRVTTRRLDALIREGQLPWENLIRPIMVKIDTEGSEKRVIDGFGAYLSDVAYLLVEIENTEQRGQHYNLLQLSSALAAHGFDQCKMVHACYDGPDAPAYADVFFWSSFRASDPGTQRGATAALPERPRPEVGRCGA